MTSFGMQNRKVEMCLSVKDVFVARLYADLCHEQFVIFGGTKVDRAFAEEVLHGDMFLEHFPNRPGRIRYATPLELRRYSAYCEGAESTDIGPILLVSQRWEIA
jgi:hypothetical protein